MSYASDRLREFHEAFGVERSTTETTARRRMTLHDEEGVELHNALELLRIMPGSSRHLEDVAEELADVMVIAYGTADLLGIDLDVAFRLKMDANMAKLPPCGKCEGMGRRLNEGGESVLARRVTGDDFTCFECGGTGKGEPIKILKPGFWRPADMSEAIK